jgi:hypothetical protein
LVELIRSGRGALVAEVLQSAPFDLSFGSVDIWETIKIGAHALLLGEEAVVRAVSRLDGRPGASRRSIAWSTVELLKEAGRDGVASAFAARERVWGGAACDHTQGDEAEASRLSATLQSSLCLQSMGKATEGKGKEAVVRGPVWATAPRHAVKWRRVVAGSVVVVLAGFFVKWFLG